MNAGLADLAELVDFARSTAQAAFLVFLRIGATLALLPAFGEQIVPRRIRLVVALAFTATLLPIIAPAMPTEPGLLAAAAEVIAGLALGAVFRLFILALQIAGTMIAQATSLSQIAGGAAPEPLPAVGHLLTSAGLALAVMADLHIRLTEAFILSYDILPAGRFPGVESLSEWGVAHVAHAFRLAFILALPFTIAALMYNMALGAINRAMPSLMVAFIGAPALSGAGLILIAILSPLLLSVWADALGAFMDAPFEAPT